VILKHSIREPASHQRGSHFLNVIPETAGPRLATLRGGVIHSLRSPGLQTLKTGSHLAAVMLAPAPGNRAALGSDRLQDCEAPTGSLVIHPANVEARAVWSNFRESMIVAIRPESLLELAANELNLGYVSLRPPAFGTVDLQALRIAQLLKAELAQGEPANELYVDSLITAFALHLLRNYSQPEKSPPNPRSGLSPNDAKKVREFLNENFTRKLSVAELAGVVGLSPFYFIRAFAGTFGQSPHQYILGLRLNFAEKLLVESNIRIAEIAYLSGFSSQSHLTAAMKRSRNATPADLRRKARVP